METTNTNNLDTQHEPSLAILIPCYNEEEFIGRCLDSLLANDYPKKLLDIVVIDGMSTDQTRNIVDSYSRKHPHIRMIDNPFRHKPIALNLGINQTDSDVVMRIDAHSTYAPDYVRKLVKGLYIHECDNIGGIRETHISGPPWQRALGHCISHRFAVGNAHWRTGSNSLKEVDTVLCGCYKREVFKKIGFFNEKLIRTQDREFNYRLIQSGGRILLDPSVRCTYFPRTSLRHYLSWNHQGAKWVFKALRLSSTNHLTIRNFVPPLFLLNNVFFLLALLAFVLVGPQSSPLFLRLLLIILSVPVAIYWVLATYHAIRTAKKNNDWAILFPLIIAFGITHLSYGAGALAGILGWLSPRSSGAS